MGDNDSQIEELLERAAQHDPAAVDELMRQHRAQLLQMVALRMDRRLVRRIDPSDIVQDGLTEACACLSEYLRNRVIPFYPWLRRFIWQRLVQVHRQHLDAEKRSIRREAFCHMALPDESAAELAGRLVAAGTSPDGHLLREEMRAQVRSALAQLADHDRELLTLWYLEQLSAKEIAAVLDIGISAVNMRHLRALQRLRRLLNVRGEGSHIG